MNIIIDVSQPGVCRSCGQKVYWRKEKSGKANPYDPPKHCPTCTETGLLCDTCHGAVYTQISHFATCPQAAQHRRAR